MLRIYFMQQWYALSTRRWKTASTTWNRCGASRMWILAASPDETTICKFRHLLEAHGLNRTLFEQTKRYLSDMGMMVSAGTIRGLDDHPCAVVDEEQGGQRDPEMASTKQGNTFHFDVKAHVGTDTKRRLHSVATTPASVHDARPIKACCLHGRVRVIYGDKVYAEQRRKE